MTLYDKKVTENINKTTEASLKKCNKVFCNFFKQLTEIDLQIY